MSITLDQVLNVRCIRDAVRLSMLTNLMCQPMAAIGKVQQLAYLVNDPSLSIRYAAVTALSNTGAAGVPALIRALGTHQPTMVRTAAIQALMMNEHTATPALPMLAECLNSPDAVVRDQAAHALAKIGAPGLPFLQTALHSPSSITQIAAATALSRAGPSAVGAVDDLRAIRGNAPRHAIPSLIAAEMKMTGDTSSGMTHLVELLRDPDHGVREAAVRAVGELGPMGMPLHSLLMNGANDPSAQVRIETSKAIFKVAPDSPMTQNLLRHFAFDHDPCVRSSAMLILPGMGYQAKEVIDEKLRKSTGHDLAFARSAKYRLRQMSRPPAWSVRDATREPLRPLDDVIRKI